MVQLLFSPLTLTSRFAFAQETTTETTTATVAPTSIVEEPAPVVEQPKTPGPQEPTGPENTSYTYNPQTGLWENQYYTWDPVSKKTSPKSEKTYSYNPSTGAWDTNAWIYAPESGKYVPTTISVPTAAPADQTLNTTNKPANELSTTSTGLLQSGAANLVRPGSLEVTTYNSNNNGYFDNFFNADISVSVSANAQSGNASVLQNTIGGNALTGNASSTATILNLLQSTWGISGLAPNMFTENIQGDYFGDIVLDPSLLQVENNNNFDELVVNSTQNVSVVNNIDLKAQSGDALVQGSTQAGDATSGSATAILNLMNIINSSISTGQSFIGMLNIFGNFEGDVLMPNNPLESLLASNIPTTEINLAEGVDSSLVLNNENNVNIDNNITATAVSGDAVVGMNTEAGNAVSGSAGTSITVFNLIGSNVVAERALLVFVNVEGTWVGFITGAPEGSNAAMLGGGVESHQNISGNTEYTTENNVSITNNVNLSATTGSASVLQNTTAGRATSGNASAAANITNISNSTFSLANWFGMLFINIFGNWNGSFGTDTAFGDAPDSNPNPVNPSSPTNPATTPSSSTPNQAVRVFSVTVGRNSSGGTSITSATPVIEEDVPPPTVLSESDDNKKMAFLGNTDSSGGPTSSNLTPILWGSVVLAALAFLLYRRRLALQ